MDINEDSPMAEASPPEGAGSETSTPWWGDFNIEVGEIRRWKIDPLTLYVQRKMGHWDFRHSQGPDWTEGGVAVAEPVPEGSLPGDEIGGRRVGFNSTKGILTIIPSLPDRPVVTRPEFEFILPPNEDVTLYVSTPLWLRIVSDNQKEVLLDVPTWRLSDTWFGTPIRGELCYASRTTCQQNPDSLMRRANRAITPVVIRNLASTPQRLDRIALPLPRLGLFLGADGRIWTQGLTLERGKDGDLSRGRRDVAPPKKAGAATLIGSPRVPSEDFFLIRAFQDLFIKEATL